MIQVRIEAFGGSTQVDSLSRGDFPPDKARPGILVRILTSRIGR